MAQKIPPSAPLAPLPPVDYVRTARDLHSQLLEPGLTPQEKARLAREISGLIFAAEATALNITNPGRIVCLRIKTHAYLCTTVNPPRTPPECVWTDYRQLETLLEE